MNAQPFAEEDLDAVDYDSENENGHDLYDEYLSDEFGTFGPIAITLTYSEEKDVVRIVEKVDPENLGMPITDDLRNVVSVLIQRLVIQKDLPMKVFDTVLTRFPEIITPAADNPYNHQLSNVLSALLRENQEERPFSDALYPGHPHIKAEGFIKFLEYLRNHRPPVVPGYEFFVAVFTLNNRELKAYLIEKQLTFVREMLRRVETVPDERLLPEQVSALRTMLAYFTRRHALHAIGRSRRGNGKRARRTRRTRRNI